MSGFGSNPTTSTQGALATNQFPLSSVAEPGRANGDLTALEGGPGSVDSNSNRTAPASVYIKDGGNVAQGTTTDAAVTGDNSGTLSAKLRGLTKILADIWDSTNHLFHQNIKQVGGTAIDTNSGNKSAGTQRVVLATDQPQLTNALKVDGSGVTQPVSGTVTSNAGTGTFTNQQSNNTADYDTGAGTQTMTMFGLALPASGGAVAGGTSTNPVQVSLANTATNSTAVKVDGSAVTQPISGTVSITANSAVNVAQVGGTTTDTNSGNKSAGTLRVVLATDQPALTNKLLVTPDSVALPANQSVNVAQINGVTTTMGNGVSGTGVQRVTVASDSTGVLGASQSGTWTVQPGNTANTTAWLMQDVAGTSGGSTASHTITASGTNATSLKGSAGMVYGFSISNSNASARFFKLYNKASSPTVGTDTPVMTVQVPGSATVIRAFPVGLVFATGIAWAITTGIADSDTGSVGTDISVDIDYK